MKLILLTCLRRTPGIIKPLVLLTLVIVSLLLSAAVLARELPTLFKPNRILVVIGDQWKDPESFLISGDSDFKRVAVLLKSWCVPFDVIRLDEQILDQYHFLDPNTRPRYGAVVWLAQMNLRIRRQNLEPLRQAVMDHDIGLVVLGEAARVPVLQSLLGIRWIGEITAAGQVMPSGPNFITEGTLDRPDDAPSASAVCTPVIEAMNSEVLVYRGRYPIVTVRNVRPNVRAVWIGGNPETILESQAERTWLRRSLAESVGYMMVRTWKNHVILRMDDPGAAQNAWLERWHYPSLTARQIRERVLEPLKRHNAILTVFVVPGFVNDNTRSVEPSWQRKFVDAFGTLQDYPSTKIGLDEGVSRGLIEIQSHGWTHMQPDLESDPGPWWGAPLDKQKAEEEWYREFVDRVRGREIPASVQLRRMRISREWIRHQFGQEPVAFRPPGFGVSKSFERNTWRLAARAGFGWLDGYLSPDMAVEGWLFEGTEDVPEFRGVPPDGHDRGLTIDPSALDRYLQRRDQAHYLGYAEYIAYLHANVRAEGKDSLVIKFEWPGSMGMPLVERNSQWTLLLSDWQCKLLGSGPYTLQVDSMCRSVPASNKISFEIPAGKRKHRVILFSN